MELDLVDEIAFAELRSGERSPAQIARLIVWAVSSPAGRKCLTTMEQRAKSSYPPVPSALTVRCTLLLPDHYDSFDS